ncbi:membrane protein [Spirochaetia bacterium]|nr:membrane protein [Spirochaetia bacterium]
MAKKLIIRITIDITMTILFLCAYAYRITGDTTHEWIGVSMFSLVVAHTIINRRWYKQIFKGAYNFRRVINTAFNVAIALAMGALIITGFLQSRAVLAFLALPGGMALRQIHTTAAYWLLFLIAVHIGLHWQMIMNAFRKMLKINGENHARKMILRVIAILIVAYGIWSSFDRDIFAKLFQGFSFDYWDESRPAILFFTENISIMGIYVFASYYLVKLFETNSKRDNVKKQGVAE